MSVQSIHQFAEKVALISDAASPVGRAVAMQLALQGSYVIGLFQDEVGSLDELAELGTLAHGLKADPSTLPERPKRQQRSISFSAVSICWSIV